MQKMPFRPGQIYNRRTDIHAVWRGQQQGGIATPATAPFIFLFTGEVGEQHGYSDGWDDSGVFHYTGEGQIGDMAFVRGNRAIRDHAENGKDLLLFEATKKSGFYRFVGVFACAGWEIRDAPDTKGNLRAAVVFHLIPEKIEISNEPNLPPVVPKIALKDLRRLALAAAAAGQGKGGKDAARRYYERSEIVRTYVLTRAGGVCEGCKKPAPFSRKDGTAYLEPHHIRRVSDGGPDHPAWVAALCPTCHREVHYGANGPTRNEDLMKYLASVEQD